VVVVTCLVCSWSYTAFHHIEEHLYHHHQITKLSHSINAIYMFVFSLLMIISSASQQISPCRITTAPNAPCSNVPRYGSPPIPLQDN
jgi:divalent metal cation (Fe/Co/Zn/Cd) transporter